MRQAGGSNATTRVFGLPGGRAQQHPAQASRDLRSVFTNGFHQISNFKTMNMTKELSESLLAACKAVGIEEPRFIAQDQDEPYVWHYDTKPDTKVSRMWTVYNGICTKIHHPPYADDWEDSLLEFVEPQGEPLADVLPQHGDLISDTTEMVILYDVADTSKKVDDACEIAYHAHLEKGNVFRWSRHDCYRAAWQDALAWKGGDQ